MRLRSIDSDLPTSACTASTYPLCFSQDAANSARLEVEDRLLLEATVPWVAVPPALMVHHAGRSFEVRARAFVVGMPQRCGFMRWSASISRSAGAATNDWPNDSGVQKGWMP